MGDWVSKEEALAKMQRYCAYQERCHQEVRRKLLDLGVYGDWLEEVMAQLIEENFLNEERFARAYARGKFHIKQWGRKRICRELKQREVTDYCIRAAMQEIDEADYRRTLEAALSKKAESLKGEEPVKLRNKLVRYALSRGFEAELAWQAVDDLFSQ